MALELPSSIEQTGLKPHIVTGVLVQICRAIFSDPETIEEPNLKRYLWNPDPKLSRIQIESIYRYKTEDVQERPAVIVKRGNWVIEKLAIGDAYNAPLETGFEENSHIVVGKGTHTMFCLGTTGLEAELVGTEVYQALLGFLAVIRKQFCFAEFRVQQIGEIGRFEESSVHFAVPITVTYKFFIRWKLLRQTPEWARSLIITETV